MYDFNLICSRFEELTFIFKKEQFISKSRKLDYVFIRSAIAAILYEPMASKGTHLNSLQSIGLLLGRSHATVLNMLKRSKIDTDIIKLIECYKKTFKDD